MDELKISDLNGKNFFIPDYQRGYRWDKTQIQELLDDIDAFVNKKRGEDEIYCLQPLVTSPATDPVTKEKTERIVDGQQRLTTIHLLMTYFRKHFNDIPDLPVYEIRYRTRNDSSDFLNKIDSKSEKDALENVDYYHMRLVYSTINEWFENKQSELGNKDDKYKEYINKFLDVLLNKVEMIEYRVKKEEELRTFSRLNIGKIGLTDSELIKALLLNRNNFDNAGEVMQHKLADEWYEIETTLQNDEFWLFIHDRNYDKPTRIDFILDLLSKNNSYDIPRDDYKTLNKDKHFTYRYFDKVFKTKKIPAAEIWKKVREYFAVLKEWYNDYEMFHYIGYLIAVKGTSKGVRFINECVKLWQGDKADFEYSKKIKIEGKDKQSFINELKKEIVYKLKYDQPDTQYTGYNALEYKFLGFLIDDVIKAGNRDEKYDSLPQALKNYIEGTAKDETDVKKCLELMDFEGDTGFSKRCCVNLLLLHNIETSIRYNKNLESNSKYTLPYFKRFPFHLYNMEDWQVEHIRPNAGSAVYKEKERLIFLAEAKEFFTIDKDKLEEYFKGYDGTNYDYSRIDDKYKDAETRKKLIERDSLFKEICASITRSDADNAELPEANKNKIYNYTLLDSKTNQEYGNHVFPYKRKYIQNLEQGRKLKYEIEGRKPKEVFKENATPFVLDTTKNIFTKNYSKTITTTLYWTENDADHYWKDMQDKLKEYFDMLNEEIGNKGDNNG